MKYIKFLVQPQGRVTEIVIWGGWYTHRDMANKLRLSDEEIVSAGFFSCEPDSVKCYGESHSLKVGCQEEDAGKISRIIRGY